MGNKRKKMENATYICKYFVIILIAAAATYIMPAGEFYKI